MIGCGLYHVILSTKEKQVFGFGDNGEKKLGLLEDTSIIKIPTRIEEFCGLNIKSISLGRDHSFVLVFYLLFIIFYFLFFIFYFIILLFYYFIYFIFGFFFCFFIFLIFK